MFIKFTGENKSYTVIVCQEDFMAALKTQPETRTSTQSN